MILEVEFKKLDKALCMRVLRQSNRMWEVEGAKGELTIRSSFHPCLLDDTITVRGSNIESDKHWDVINFTSNKARDAYHRKALRAIARARKEIK